MPAIPLGLSVAILFFISNFLILYDKDEKRSAFLNRQLAYLTIGSLVACIHFLIYNTLSAAACYFSLGYILVPSLTSVKSVSLLLVLMLMRPWEGIDHPSLALIPKAYYLISFISLLIHSVQTNCMRIKWQMPMTCACLFFAWVTFAGLQNQPSNLNILFEKFYPILALMFFIHQRIDTKAQLNRLTRDLSIAACCTCLIPLASMQFQSGRLAGFGMWGNSNELASLAAFPILLSVRPLGLKNIVILLLTACILLLTQSRAGILALAVGLLVSFLRSHKNFIKLAISGAAIGALVSVVSTFISRDETELSMSFDSRQAIMMSAIKMISYHPMMGVGFDNFGIYYLQYAPHFIESSAMTAHSSWLLAASENGILGGLLFTFPFLLIGYKVFRKPSKVTPIYFSYLANMTFLSHTYIFLPYALLSMGYLSVNLEGEKKPNFK